MNTGKRISNALPCFPEEDMADVLDGVRKVLTGKLTVGPLVAELERQFAATVGVSHAVAVHSATNALEAVLRFYDLRGGEVIVPADTFIATANAVLLAGGVPVIADISEKTLGLSMDSIRKCVTTETRGIILVHMTGYITPEIHDIRAFCQMKNYFLLEDAAHAHGAGIDGLRAGGIGNAGCFSFYATKVLTTAEGGMITTNEAEIAEFARSFRHHGMDKTMERCIRVGTNCRMDEVRALLGIHQLKYLRVFLQRRREIARQYERGLGDVSGLWMLDEIPGIYSSYWKFPLFFRDAELKAHVAARLKEQGIEVGTPYDPLCHQHPYYQERFGYKNGDLPVAEGIIRRYLCLPMHYGLSDDDVQYVITAVREAVRGA